MLSAFRVLRLVWINWSFSKYFSLFIFSLPWEKILILFSTTLTPTNSTSSLSKLDSSLASWNNTYTCLIIMLEIWFAFFAAKMKVFFLGIFFIIFLMILILRILLMLWLFFNFYQRKVLLLLSLFRKTLLLLILLLLIKLLFILLNISLRNILGY